MRLFLLFILIANLFASMQAMQVMQLDHNGRIVPASANAVRMLQAFSNVFDPHTPTAECHLTRDDTKKIIGIINDARSYLDGVMALLPESVSNSEIAHQKLRSSKPPFCVPYEMRVEGLELTIAFSIKRFRDNLEFLANCIL